MSLSVIAVLSWAIVSAQGGTDFKTPPSVDGKPVAVKIGFYAVDFARVTSREESFDLTGYVEMNWTDPRLAVPKAERKNASRPMDASKIWTPRIFFDNALESPRFHNEPVVECDDEGHASSWAIVSGKFSVPMDLSKFPFDRQDLNVHIGSFFQEDVQKFVEMPDLTIVGDEAFVTDWTIREPSAKVESHRYVPTQDAYSRLVYGVSVTRRSTFYVWRVMMPLTLLALVAWAAFWFEPVGLQPQISTCMAALIALVAFNFAIDFSLPKVAYLTLIDKHALIGFAFVTIAVVGVTVIHYFVTRNRLQLAKKIQLIFRIVFPIAYAIAVVVNLRSLI